MEIVLYTQRVEDVKVYGERRDCADQNITRFIEECGYVPVPIPNVIRNLHEYVSILKPKGIILTGGNSLVEYGGNAPERDSTDRQLLDIAIKINLPLYGFCRGMQSILHYFDCPLSQVEGHTAIKHTIVDIDNKQLREVNSYHNQGCGVLDIKPPLEILAQSYDGIVEWIKHQSMPIMGTMWHPEREKCFLVQDIQIVKDLFE